MTKGKLSCSLIFKNLTKPRPFIGNISHEQKFIFTPPPSTGTRTLSSFFRKNYNMQMWDGPVFFKPRVDKWGNVIRASHHFYIPKGQYGDYLIIVSVRNPYSRITSLWKKLLHEIPNYCKVPFPDKVLWMPTRSMLNYLNLEITDYIIHLETINKDVEALPFTPNKIDLPNNFKTPSKESWLNFYYDNPHAQDQVYEALEEEFKQLGYSYEIPFK